MTLYVLRTKRVSVRITLMSFHASRVFLSMSLEHVRACVRVYFFARFEGCEDIMLCFLGRNAPDVFATPDWLQLQSGFDEMCTIYCQGVDTDHFLAGFTLSHIGRQTCNLSLL